MCTQCGILTRIETPLIFYSIGQKILEKKFHLISHVKISGSSLYGDEMLFSKNNYRFFKCLSVLYKKNDMVYMERKNRPYT